MGSHRVVIDAIVDGANRKVSLEFGDRMFVFANEYIIIENISPSLPGTVLTAEDASYTYQLFVNGEQMVPLPFMLYRSAILSYSEYVAPHRVSSRLPPRINSRLFNMDVYVEEPLATKTETGSFCT